MNHGRPPQRESTAPARRGSRRVPTAVAPSLTPAQPPPPPPLVTRTAVPSDATFVASLQRRFSNQLGFLPRAAIDELLVRQRVLLGLENGEPAGYLIARPRLRCQPFTAPIVQAAVCLDVRRRKLGMQLVEAVCQDAWVDGRSCVQCWCREDLEACDFWAACGFTAVADRETGNARRKRMVLYRRPLPGCSDVTLRTLPRNAGWKGATISPARPPQLLFPWAALAPPSGLPDVL